LIGARHNGGWPRALKEKLPMKKYLIASVLIVSFTAPALADEIYVMLDMDTKKCVTMKALPENMKKYRMLGKYPTLGEAEATMHTMTECK
jgi:hypothetical protein